MTSGPSPQEKASNYFFTKDYVTHHETAWLKHLKSFINKPNVKYLEIGVLEGRSLLWMLHNVLTHPEARAYAIDPFEKLTPEFEENKKIFLENLKNCPNAEKIKFMNDFSNNIVHNFEDSFFDIGYVDGAHEADSVYADLVAIWPKLKNSGVLIVDDYQYVPKENEPFEPPKIGIDKFLEEFKNEIEIRQKCYQLILQKKQRTVLKIKIESLIKNWF